MPLHSTHFALSNESHKRSLRVYICLCIYVFFLSSGMSFPILSPSKLLHIFQDSSNSSFFEMVPVPVSDPHLWAPSALCRNLYHSISCSVLGEISFIKGKYYNLILRFALPHTAPSTGQSISEYLLNEIKEEIKMLN